MPPIATVWAGHRTDAKVQCGLFALQKKIEASTTDRPTVGSCTALSRPASAALLLCRRPDQRGYGCHFDVFVDELAGVRGFNVSWSMRWRANSCNWRSAVVTTGSSAITL
jgi:hypothetical protein